MSDSAAAPRIRAYLRERAPELRRTLDELVAIPSFPGTTRQNACQDVVRAALGDRVDRVDDWRPDWGAVRALRAPTGRRLYVPVEDERGAEHAAVMDDLRCVVASIGDGGPHLVLNGHVDVVPADPEAWRFDPFAPRRDGDRLYGRGTMDMKAGLVAALYAVRALADLDLLRRGTVSLASVPEEESGGNGTLAAIARGHVGDAVVFAEPTDLQVVHRHVGIQSFAIHAEGRAGGILRRSWGVNAIDAMGDAIVALRALSEARRARAHAAGGYDADDDPGFVNVGVLAGGDWPATRAGACDARGLMGVLPDESVDAAEAEVRAALAAAARPEAAALTVTFGAGGHAGGELPASHPLVTALLAGGRDVGVALEPSRAGTMVCDAKIVTGGGWAPSVAFGPVGAGLHAAHEWVDVPSVLRCAEVLAAGALRFCGAAA
ncbi:M20/M25/M40 family metallo-hydrolase [Conexibacter woesei]|uniref:Peptidase M20 n=1 Tax=Conexibacter woesei (strain DSM 14684 / CCUG 47730 / CIP 108061 / JCM 11494 / NBRC 100937 / ID131577) TaxID=469383 RepID=D3F999_CONWI|nr:M20/M25/M40 family metallo-hydrolase [Conexibacter woesei]ADB49066.1 peptidase M20 [Conexibacter woesei DSM 14684]